MTRHTMAQDRQRARDARAARARSRADKWRERVTAAQTPEARLTAAYDWFRSSAALLAQDGAGRDGRCPSRPAAEALMRETADCLARLAAEIDGGHHTGGYAR